MSQAGLRGVRCIGIQVTFCSISHPPFAKGLCFN